MSVSSSRLTMKPWTMMKLENTFVWEPSGENIVNTWWLGGQPNNGLTAVPEQDCVTLVTLADERGWADEYCGESFWFICEQK